MIKAWLGWAILSAFLGAALIVVSSVALRNTASREPSSSQKAAIGTDAAKGNFVRNAAIGLQRSQRPLPTRHGLLNLCNLMAS